VKESISILIVEDDPNLAFLLKTNLEQEGYSITVASDGVLGWTAFNDHQFDLCILDIMLPKQDGFQLAEMIRRHSISTPIIFLTARSRKEDVCKAFEIGGDDYLTKPFSIKELLLRIKAVLRRTSSIMPSPASMFQIASISFNYKTRQLHAPSGLKTLSTKENELLRIFCQNPEVVIDRKRFLVEVWGTDDYFVSKSLDVYITRLRKLFTEEPRISIQNYHSVGYKLVVS